MKLNMKHAGQLIAYVVFILFLGTLSKYPSYDHAGEDQASIRLTLNHAGKVKGECRKRTAQELSKLSPNMREPMDCPRERSPVRIELALDGEVIYRDNYPPSGLKKDGESAGYKRITIKAGKHRLRVRMNDDVKVEAFNYIMDREITLKPAQVLVVRFDNLSGRFIIL